VVIRFTNFQDISQQRSMTDSMQAAQKQY